MAGMETHCVVRSGALRQARLGRIRKDGAGGIGGTARQARRGIAPNGTLGTAGTARYGGAVHGGLGVALLAWIVKARPEQARPATNDRATNGVKATG